MEEQKQEESQVEEQETTTTTEAAEPISLQLPDLQGLAQVVNLAASRGAFQAKEMEAVGALYNKLTAFLDQVAKSQEDAAEKTEEGDSEE